MELLDIVKAEVWFSNAMAQVPKQNPAITAAWKKRAEFYTAMLPVEPPPPPPPPPPGTWPNAATTGPRYPLTVAPGTDAFSQSNGQVIEKLEIKGRLYIRHSNVTVRDCRIWGDLDAGGGKGWFGIQVESGSNLKVQYCEVGKAPGGTGSLDVGVQLGGGTTELAYCEIHNVSDGIQASGGASIHDNFIHDLYASNQSGANESHIDALQMFSGSGTTLIKNNWLDDTDHSPAKLLPNSCVFFQGTFGSGAVTNNYMTGGGFLLRFEKGSEQMTQSGNTFKLIDPRGWGDFSDTR